MLLNRPKEFRNGHLLPELGAGSYSFKELKDSIRLQYMLSSFYGPKNYAFKIDGNKLYIEDFYKQGNGPTLEFEKLK